MTQASLIAPTRSPAGLHPALETPRRWSPRRTGLFVVATCTGLWALIAATVVHAF